MENTEMTPKEKLQALIVKHDLKFSYDFIPLSKSRNATPGDDGKIWKSLNWKVGLFKGSRAIIATTDYAAGEANCPSYKLTAKCPGDKRLLVAWECEHGKEAHLLGSVDYISGKKPIVPQDCDVLYSLVSDSDVLDCSTFEEWANNLGYDSDSRKAERTYRACLEIALKLRKGLGEAVLAELREACQEY